MSGSSEAARKLSPKRTALNLCKITLSRWKTNWVSRASPDRCKILWPSLLIKEITEAFYGPWDSNASGWNIWVPTSIEYLTSFLVAANSATAPGVLEESCMCTAHATVTSHVRALPLHHGIRGNHLAIYHQCEPDQMVFYWQGSCSPRASKMQSFNAWCLVVVVLMRAAD